MNRPGFAGGSTFSGVGASGKPGAVHSFYFHVNTIEGAWSHIKRQIYGIHHWISDKHLGNYLSEMTWRYNRRDIEEGTRMNGLLAQVEGRLRYRELIA